MPLFKLFPGLPRRIFSSLTFFFGGIFDFFEYKRVKMKTAKVEEPAGD